jgi:cyclopropane-fatty-acyl-phospholipid synthase
MSEHHQVAFGSLRRTDRTEAPAVVFDAAWRRLQAKYGQRFYRMWKYYLMCSAGSFRSRQGQLWQLVLTKRERAGGYRSVR